MRGECQLDVEGWELVWDEVVKPEDGCYRRLYISNAVWLFVLL